ncbi:MAG: hypothetical protein K6T83_23415 [Alicyclobacillus sp.]|nr:hypothetical protein [Alicyclobacillus sp.]
MDFSTVGVLNPNEVFLNANSVPKPWCWCFNKTGKTIPVYKTTDPWKSAYDGDTSRARRIAFLHTSYPTWGYIDESQSGHIANYNFGTYRQGDTTYKILKTAVETYVYCDIDCLGSDIEGGPFFYVPAGRKILVKDGQMYDSDYTKMIIYAVENPDKDKDLLGEYGWQCPSANGGYGYLYTNIKSTSAKGKFSVDFNH